MPYSRRLTQLLLGFWAAWYAIVTLTNTTDGLKAAGVLAADWPLASGNYGLLVKTMAIYPIPQTIVAASFVAVIAWELLAALAYAWALQHSLSNRPYHVEVDRAVLLGAGLFAAFVLADELFIAFPTGIEGTHFRILVAQLVTWLVARVALPANSQ